jgi:hypothetical protein
MFWERPEGASNFVGDALASLGIGIWSWRGSTANVQCCPVAARLFGVSSKAASSGMSLDHYAAGVHPEDRDRFIDLIGRAQQTGGPFIAEYRTRDEAGTTHSVLDRGEFELGPDGWAIAARGMVVDMTSRPNGFETGHSVSIPSSFVDIPPLHQAVEHGLALHRLISVLPEGKRHTADTLLRLVLEMLGQEVAASLELAGYRPEQGNLH